MRDIQVAAENDRFLAVQFPDIRQESVFPFHSVRKPEKTVLGIGRIDRQEEEIRELQCDYPSFMVKGILPDSQPDG